VLSALKTIIDLLEKGLKIGFGVAKARRRRETLMALMTAYFVMRRIALTGHQLLELAGDKPAERFESMSLIEANKYGWRCQKLIENQLHSLQMLGHLIENEAVLDLLDPTLRKRFDRAIGEKGKGLFGIGSNLFFYLIFGRTARSGRSECENEMAHLARQHRVICTMYPLHHSNTIDIQKATSQLKRLEDAGERLRTVINTLCTSDELLNLSSEAERIVNGDLAKG
jgi:hypothetical protein